MTIYQVKDLLTGKWGTTHHDTAEDAANEAHRIVMDAITFKKKAHVVVMGEGKVIADYSTTPPATSLQPTLRLVP